MPFSWMRANPSPSRAGAWKDQYIQGIQQKARLLFNLGYSKAHTVQRIKADLAWEFDTSVTSAPAPRFIKDVNKLVKGVYDQAQSHAPKTKKPKKNRKK